jgi:CheY-like chemotaxis protein
MAATILVVDDEKNIRRTLRMVLEGSGFNTLEASSAAASKRSRKSVASPRREGFPC